MCWILLKGENIVVGHCLKALKEKQSLSEQLYQFGWQNIGDRNFGVWTISFNGISKSSSPFWTVYFLLSTHTSHFDGIPHCYKNGSSNNSNKLKLAALCGLFLVIRVKTLLVCATHACMCGFFCFYFWRKFFILFYFYFGLELRPNYTGPIAWCPTRVMETRLYSFVFFHLFSLLFHIGLIGIRKFEKKVFGAFFLRDM